MGLIEFDGDTLNDPTVISIIISSFICFFVYIPLALFYGYKFYLNHDHIIFAKRYSSITLYEIIFMIIKIIWVPIEHLSEYYTGPKQWEHQLILLGNIVLAYLVLYCWVWRQWLSSYDINLTHTVVNNQWRLYIDPEFEESQLKTKVKWYLENKKTYGNYKWVRNRLLLIVILCINITFWCLFYAAYYNDNDERLWFYMFCICLIPYLSPMIFLLIIFKKTPKFEDNYFIQQELKYIFIALSIMYISYIITFIYLSIGELPSNPNMLVFILSVENNIVILMQFICLMISTKWVIKKMEKVISSNSYQKVKKSYLQKSTSKSITQSLLNDPHLELIQVDALNQSLISSSSIDESRQSLQSHQHIDITLYQVLGHIKSFELYMVHLSKEFSLECLLSLIEFVEYQKLILQLITNDDSNNNNDSLWCNMIKLPEYVPRSAIVYGDAKGKNRIENCKIKGWCLYIKYIQEGSDFEINIPGEMRRKYKRLMEDYDEWINQNDQYDMNKLLVLFDPLIEQMISLLTDSFRRFQSTKQFLKLRQLILLQ